MKITNYLIGLSLLFLFNCQDQLTRTETQQDRKKIEKKNKKVQTKQFVQEEQSVPQEQHTTPIEKFVPQQYSLLDSTRGSLKNGKEIIVLVLESKIDHEKDRTLLILEKIGSGFKQMTMNKKGLMLCKNCGGVFGDPYAGIGLAKNVLTISHYGGSAWRWSEQHVFRYQFNRWELIGATYQSYWTYAPCIEDGNKDVTSAAGQLEDINFSTNKMHIVHTKDDACVPYMDKWETFDKKKPILLKDFPGQPNQWPNGKIKDGDGESN